MRVSRTNPEFVRFLLGTCGILLATAALGAGDSNVSAARSRYQQERAACGGAQDRATCLREAGAAFQEARRGQPAEAPAELERNRFARCEPLPAGDREDCERRMRGEGTVSGSVEGGGLYRELITTVPAD